MRIAMLGTKGVPAASGGIEKYIEEVGSRLASRGHAVTVFGSYWYLRDYTGDTFRGMRVRRMPSLHYQATDALTNAFLATLSIALAPYDIVNLHGYASYYFVPVLKLLGKKTVVTSHGLVDGDWENTKYPGFATAIIRQGGAVGIRCADHVATVADFWQGRIRLEYRREACVLPSGIDCIPPLLPDIITKKYGLRARGYILFLGRIDPIKRIEWVIQLRDLPKDMKIVIAGGAQDRTTETYYRELQELARGKTDVVFTGPVRGEEKTELLSNCLFFINPSRSEGLPVVILEAMNFARCCIASNIPAHAEVIDDGQTGYLFPPGSPEELNRCVLALLELKLDTDSIGKRAREAAIKKYCWDRTAAATEQLFKEALYERP